MATATAPQITLDEHGVAWIAGTKTKVIEVALSKRVSGLTPEELQAELPHLTLAQVYAALAYYHANRVALDAEIARRKQWAEELGQRARESPFAKRLRDQGLLP